MLYDQFPEQTATPIKLDTIDMGVTIPTPIPRGPTTTGPIDIPVRTAPAPASSAYADYTDYGEGFFDDAFDYDVYNDMLELQRVPNRRDSGYESPASPVEKVLREERVGDEGVMAHWAGEHDVGHHGEFKQYSFRVERSQANGQAVNVARHGPHHRRRSSLLAPTTPSKPASSSPTYYDYETLSPKASLPPTSDAHAHEASWPSKTLDRCPTCKAALKWKYLHDQHAPCVCEKPRAGSPPRARRDAWGEEERLGRMGRWVDEHLSWPVEV